MFTIEKGILQPSNIVLGKNGRRAVYPFASMEVGDSFFAPKEVAGKAMDAAKHFKARTAGWGYSSFCQDDGTRIWRIR